MQSRAKERLYGKCLFANDSETLLSHLMLRIHLNERRNQGFPMNYPGPLEEREEVSANVCYVFAKSLPS